MIQNVFAANYFKPIVAHERSPLLTQIYIEAFSVSADTTDADNLVVVHFATGIKERVDSRESHNPIAFKQ